MIKIQDLTLEAVRANGDKVLAALSRTEKGIEVARSINGVFDEEYHCITDAKALYLLVTGKKSTRQDLTLAHLTMMVSLLLS